jgi:hypothetical protein
MLGPLGVHRSIASLNHRDVLSFKALGEVAEGLSSVIIVVGGLMDPTGSNMKGFNNKGGKRCTTVLMDNVIAEMSLRPPRTRHLLKAPEVKKVGRRFTDAKLDAIETRSKEIKVDKNPHLLDMSQLPSAAMALLQQLLASLSDKAKATEVEPQMKKGASGAEAKQIDVPKSLAQCEARGNKDFSKPPYCYRCLSRGHAKDCVAQLVCEVCDITSHVKARCPVHKKAVKSFAMTCSYAVDGLGFYYKPHSAVPRSKEQSKSAVIKVIHGSLNAAQVLEEMEDLVLGKGKWSIEEINPNTFKTSFPSRSELERMIEWGEGGGGSRAIEGPKSSHYHRGGCWW